MKKQTKLIISLAVACAGTMVLGACKTKDYYDDFKKNGDNVIVYFDVNGGLLSNEEGLKITNLFNYEKLADGVELLAPDDSRKGNTQTIPVSNSGYFLAGWYKEMKERKDDQGRALDEDGLLCSESGKPQSFEYSGRWNFGDKLKQSDVTLQDDGSYAFTLHAAWIPYFSYRIMGKENGVWTELIKRDINPETEAGQKLMNIEIPQWNDDTGAMDYGQFPKVSGKTFKAVYSSESSTEELTSITHPGTWNPEKGISENGIVRYYVDYDEGEWFRIRTAEQLASNMTIDGCYQILDDLDFNDKTASGYSISWPNAMVTGSFGGKIIGNGHSIKNIEIVDRSTNNSYGGLFGRITDKAEIENVTFENVSYTLVSGSIKNAAQFGLFAGELSANAKMTNVTVTGKFYIGSNSRDPWASQTRYNYDIGKVTGNLVTNGITADIEVIALDNMQVQVGDNGSVTATEKN